MAEADDGRLLAIAPRADDLISFFDDPFAKIIAEFDEVSFNPLLTDLIKELDGGAQSQNAGGVERARLETFCRRRPGLVRIAEIEGMLDRHPPDQSRPDAVEDPFRDVKQSAAVRSEQKLMSIG